ncbi:MAG: hypothetical protein ACJ74Y_14165 [Bryobacteraceae bacterium]|jgi:hypothetical protein
MQITYVAGPSEPLHPDPEVASRFREVGMSDCLFGCKIYGDPRSNVCVLKHNRIYGCPKG